MLFPDYTHAELEPQVLDYWKQNKVVEKLRKRNKKGKKFYFLEGPPYTSGHIHLGHAWNMALKDMVLRYKRALGYHVWDRMGYDMHGLPTEQKVMTKLNLKNKEDILAFGLKKFMQECEIFCKEMMLKMNEDFQRIGATLDFSEPYQPIKKEFMEAEWWLIKQAYEQGRLYQGLRTMHWDAATQTAVAKHEMEYKQLTDTSIYVKFPAVSEVRQNGSNSEVKKFFLIWTTTPWTIPLNLAVMVHPELKYVEVEVEINGEKERWVLAEELLTTVMKKLEIEQFQVKKTCSGKELEGQHYFHPLDVKKHLPKDIQENPRLFTVLLSSEYVDASSGTGLVHCAPGCGPEDYEVGHFYHLPPFNCVNESGFFENFGAFTGWQAKLEDKKFIQAIDDAGVLLYKEPYIHDYPHGERSHEPVIFRTTKQWFFKVEDLKEKLLKANEEIYWHPQSAKNAFTSWLENLRDNSITKQRFWGTPVPIWKAQGGDGENDEFIIVGSLNELEELSGKKIKNMHIPDIDTITITRNGKTYHRIPDVLDVWIDAGTVSWNCLNYPVQKELFEQFFPADFILEGKDQIRGWFNLLMIASFLALGKPSFKAVYMHGFVNDVSGVKMSKSLGNIISPDELTKKHGTDVLRYYMCQTNAAEDINFSWEECATKERQLHILWNLHKLVLNMARELECSPQKIKKAELGVAEEYIFSRLHSTIKKVTELLESYHLDEVIAPLEEFYLTVSRTYVQMVREKNSSGSEKEKEAVLFTLYTVLFEFLKMFQLISPFICEAMYLNLKEAFGLKEASISQYSWPKVEEKKINLGLEAQIFFLQDLLTAASHAREKAQLGLRWPVKEIVVETKSEAVQEAITVLRTLFLQQTNAKEVRCVAHLPGVQLTVKPNHAKIGPAYGKLSQEIIAKLNTTPAQDILDAVEKEGAYVFSLQGKEIQITQEMLLVERESVRGYTEGESKNAQVYVSTERTEALEAEGYAREFTRQLQQLRKDAGLEKRDRVELYLQADEKMKLWLEKFFKEMQEKVGAEKFTVGVVHPEKSYPHERELAVKKEKMKAWMEKRDG